MLALPRSSRCLRSRRCEISIQLPTITFSAPPPLVVVQPGVQVVEDNDEEVFFVDNYYWVRRGPRWYRTRDHRGGWVVVDGPGVPPSLVRLPPGSTAATSTSKAVMIDRARARQGVPKEEARQALS